MIRCIVSIPLVLQHLTIAAATEIHQFPTDLNTYTFKEDRIIEKKIDNRNLAILGFIINKNTLSDVQKVLGASEVLPRQEHAPNRICYTSALQEDGTTVIFEAGALGGWKYLTAVIILSDGAKFSERDRCAGSQKINKEIGTRGNLKLGLYKQEIKIKLGEPTAEMNESFLYFYQTKQQFTVEDFAKLIKIDPDLKNDPRPYYDITAHIEATFTNDRVTRLRIGKIESY